MITFIIFIIKAEVEDYKSRFTQNMKTLAEELNVKNVIDSRYRLIIIITVIIIKSINANDDIDNFLGVMLKHF